MASPKVGSPTTSCQCSTGIWLASSVPRRASPAVVEDFEEGVPPLTRREKRGPSHRG